MDDAVHTKGQGEFIFRSALPQDEDALLDLAKHLHTMNLLPERQAIRDLLSRSAQGFVGEHDEFRSERYLLFVLEGPGGDVVGTSSLFSQHGNNERAHHFFTVNERVCRSTVRRQNGNLEEIVRSQKSLILGATDEGPTEIGGLVLHPKLRGHPQKLGRLCSLARFLAIKSFRPWFRESVLAELLPELTKDDHGAPCSPFWDALGSIYTGLSYAEADALCATDNRFIQHLLPAGPIPVELLPEGAQRVIGNVGKQTQGARHLLEKIGFSYRGRIDPFDGGPHVEVETNAISLIREAVSGEVVQITDATDTEGLAGAKRCIVSAASTSAPRFRCVMTDAVIEEGETNRIHLGSAAYKRLAPQKGEVMWAVGV